MILNLSNFLYTNMMFFLYLNILYLFLTQLSLSYQKKNYTNENLIYVKGDISFLFYDTRNYGKVIIYFINISADDIVLLQIYMFKSMSSYYFNIFLISYFIFK